jgi:hypothetical protein
VYAFSLKEYVFAAITRSILMSLKIFATQPFFLGIYAVILVCARGGNVLKGGSILSCFQGILKAIHQIAFTEEKGEIL